MYSWWSSCPASLLVDEVLSDGWVRNGLNFVYIFNLAKRHFFRLNVLSVPDPAFCYVIPNNLELAKRFLKGLKCLKNFRFQTCDFKSSTCLAMIKHQFFRISALVMLDAKLRAN